MKRLLKLIFTLLISINAAAAADLPIFKDGSTVCFLGNSITQSGEYQMVLQAYYATRYPGSNVKFISCGIGGDTATDMIARFDRDVMRYKPDYCFLMTGMNDMSAALYKAGLEESESLEQRRKACKDRYEKLAEKLVNMMISAGVKPILMTPTIYDETAKIPAVSSVGKCDALLWCAEYIKGLGVKYDLSVVDHTQFMLDINLEAQKSDPTYTIIGADRVHPREVGHFIMAHRIITTLMPNESKYVSLVSIDAQRGRVEQSEGCDVKLESGGAVSFKLHRAALPMAVLGRYEGALQHIPFTELCNQEIVRVSGLKRGRYLLKIDSKCVDTLSAAELASGVNLATNRLTPQYTAAAEVFRLCEEYHAEQAIIRAIANVEFKRLAKYKGANDLEQKLSYLKEMSEKSKGKPWYGNGKKIVATYEQNIKRESDVVARMDSLRRLIYSKGLQQERLYRVEKL